MLSLTLVSFAPATPDGDLYRPAPSTSGERSERRMAVVVCAVLLLLAAVLAALVT